MGLLWRASELERLLIQNPAGALRSRLNTDIDRLYYVVRAASIIPLGKACKVLNIDRKQASEFARILSDQNLIGLHRHLVGDITLISLEGEHRRPEGSAHFVLITLFILSILTAAIIGIFIWNARL